MLRQRHIIYLAALLMDMSVAGVSFAVSRRAAELGATAGQLGWLGAMWIGTYAVGALLAGRWSDRLGRRRVAQAGCVLAAMMALACAATTRFGFLLVLTGVFGVGIAGFWPTLIAWLSEGAPDSGTLNARLSKFSVAWNVGLLIGFALTGVIFRHWPRLAFIIPAGLILLDAALLALPATTDGERATGAAPVNPPVPKGRGFRKTAWLANFALTLTATGASAVFPQLATTLGVSADVHGGLLALGRGAALVTFLMLPVLAFWRTRLWPLWIAQAIAAVGIALLGWASATWLFALGFALMGAVSGYTYQASIFFTMEEVHEKGQGSGLHEAILATGMAVGPLMAGGIGARTTLRAPYFFCAGILLVLVVAQMILVFVRRRATLPA